jgi:hypothetical protein
VHLTRAFLSSKNRLVMDRSFGDRLFVGNGIVVVLTSNYCVGIVEAKTIKKSLKFWQRLFEGSDRLSGS